MCVCVCVRACVRVRVRGLCLVVVMIATRFVCIWVCARTEALPFVGLLKSFLASYQSTFKAI
jgi:hypothetical protein